MPCFVECRVEWKEYALRNGIVHLGSSPSSGHYRAFDVDPADNRVWVADDTMPTCVAGDAS